MKNVTKYQKQYYMPPVKCMKWTEKEYVETDYVSRSTYKDNDGYKMTFGEYLRVGFWMVVIVGVVALILIL